MERICYTLNLKYPQRPVCLNSVLVPEWHFWEVGKLLRDRAQWEFCRSLEAWPRDGETLAASFVSFSSWWWGAAAPQAPTIMWCLLSGVTTTAPFTLQIALSPLRGQRLSLSSLHLGCLWSIYRSGESWWILYSCNSFCLTIDKVSSWLEGVKWGTVFKIFLLTLLELSLLIIFSSAFYFPYSPSFKTPSPLGKYTNQNQNFTSFAFLPWKPSKPELGKLCPRGQIQQTTRFFITWEQRMNKEFFLHSLFKKISK